MLIKNKFAVEKSKWNPFIRDFLSSVLFNNPSFLYKKLVYGRRIARCQLKQDPIFIIGHWRTGTTLLHELMSLDENHIAPTTLQCLAPNSFLVAERLIRKFLKNGLPTTRVMDNMKAGWDLPQEDEYALMILGEPSPYWDNAFPQNLGQNKEYLTLENISPRKLRRWKNSFLNFLKEVSFKNPKRIVLKSPTHSYRIKILLEMFPDAKFIHILRNPYEVYPSTFKLLRNFYGAVGYQHYNEKNLEGYIFRNFEILYDKLEEGKELLPPDQFYELKYEDLIRDPLAKLQDIYSCLELGDFKNVEGRIKKDLESRCNFQKNRHEFSDEMMNKIESRWGKYIKKYGYHRPVPGEG